MIRSVLFYDPATMRALYREYWVEGGTSTLREEKEYFLEEFDMPVDDALSHLVDYYPDALLVYVNEIMRTEDRPT